MLIDTHVHYNLEPFFSSQDRDNWKKYWFRAQQEEVAKSIVVGTNVVTSTVAIQIAQDAEGLFSSIGCHPNEYHESFLNAESHQVASFDSLFDEIDNDIAQLELLIEQKNVISIGETGLDYYRLPNEGLEREIVIQLQKYGFEKHIQLALKFELPLILHVRDKLALEQPLEGNAYWDALTILQKCDVRKCTLHCASGPLAYIESALELGAYVGFDGNIAYPNAQHIRKIFGVVPSDKKLVETDAPFLPPQQFRGQICEPWMLSKTVEYIETELKADRDSFSYNAEQLFNI